MDRVWGKVKSATRVLHSSEEDGDTEQSTVVHRSMVKFYEEHGQAIPEWLEDRKTYHVPQRTHSEPQRSQQLYEPAPRSRSEIQPTTTASRPSVAQTTHSMGHLNISSSKVATTTTPRTRQQPSTNSRMMERMRSGQSTRIARRN